MLWPYVCIRRDASYETEICRSTNLFRYSFILQWRRPQKQTNKQWCGQFFLNRLFSVDSSYSNDGFWVKGIVFPPWRRVFEPTRGKCLWPSIIIIEQYSAHCTPYLAWPHMSTVKHSKLNVDLYKKYHSKHFFIWLAITWSGRVRDHQNFIFTKIWSFVWIIYLKN